MVSELLNIVFSTAGDFFVQLPGLFGSSIGILYNSTTNEFTEIGLLIILPLAIGLAWFGINFIVGLVKKAGKSLKNKN